MLEYLHTQQFIYMEILKNKAAKLINKAKGLYTRWQKYLPSRRFSVVFGVAILVLVLAFSVSYLFQFGKGESSKKKDSQALTVENQTILELLQNDTDKDSVYDWEEALWGTNKYKSSTFEGKSDVQYIEDKKKELKVNDLKEDKTLTETDKFAREFFSAYTALQQAEQLDPNTIQNFASALGEKIITPDLEDKYTITDIETDDDEPLEDYYTNISGLFSKYEARGIGNEIPIISSGLEAYQLKEIPNSFNELNQIAKAYQDFAKAIMGTKVPSSLSSYHLRIANSAHNTGVSILNMSKVINDPIVGVSGVSEYEKYSEALTDAVEDLEKSFEY